MPSNGKTYDTTDVALRRIWMDSIRVRIAEAKIEIARAQKQIEAAEETLTELAKELP
jgi:outer membrane protein TolC